MIQDDPQDWRADNDHAGCILPFILQLVSHSNVLLLPLKDFSHVRSCEVVTNWTSGDPERYILIPKRFWDEQLDCAPLSHCGWFFSERWLAPRILHFSSDQLLWECCELNASEAYPHGIPATTCGITFEVHHELRALADLQSYEN